MNTDSNQNGNPFRPTKKLGQNFLTDKNVVTRIIDSARLDRGDVVIEVGPGKGALTGRIASLVKRVYAIEKDNFLYSRLHDKYASADNMTLINEDVLKTDFSNFKSDTKIKFIANLPYNITSPVLSILTEKRDIFSTIIIMIQKEVGDRIASGPGNKTYGALTVMIRTFFDVTHLFTVSPGAFRPRPKVDSVVIKLVPTEKNSSLIIDKKLFTRVVKSSFSSRRKMIVNSLKNEFNKEEIDLCLDKSGIDGKRRAETVSVQEFIRLANSIYELQQSTSSIKRSF